MSGRRGLEAVYDDRADADDLRMLAEDREAWEKASRRWLAEDARDFWRAFSWLWRCQP